MAKIKYKCDDNGHEFIGNDFTSDCPKCGSTIQPISGGSSGGFFEPFIEFLKQNKITVGAVAALIVIAIMFSKSGGSNPSGELYSVDAPQPEGKPYLEVTVTEYKTVDGNTKSRKLEVNEVLDVIDENVLIDNGQRKVLIKDKNKIYLCPNDTNGLFTLTFKTKSGKKFRNPKDPKNLDGMKEDKKGYTFSLKGIAESSEADCKPVLNQTDIAVETTGNCKLKVKILKNLKGAKVFVSVSGQTGNYELNKFEWDKKPLIGKKLDVWVRIDEMTDADALSYIRNGENVLKDGCVDCPDINAFTQIANAYGDDPLNTRKQKQFQSFIYENVSNCVIYLNGEIVDLAQLQNKVRVNALNEDKKYKLEGKPICVVQKDNSTLLTLKFQEY